MAEPSRIHVLGTGSIGVFAAHTLKDVPQRPPISLLLHRESLLHDFNQAGSHLTLENLNGDRVVQDDYEIEVKRGDGWHAAISKDGQHIAQPTTISTGISNLILTVKTLQTVNALRSLKERLSRDSTILFLQNGSGQIEEVNEQLFPDPNTRPNYLVGIISHGVITLSPFCVRHTGPSATSIGAVPRADGLSSSHSENDENQAQPSYLLEALPLAPRLTATSYRSEDITQYQIEKLVVNAFNAVGALADSSNHIYKSIPDEIAALVRETSSVARALPELMNIAGVEERFSYERLRAMTVDILWKNVETTNSTVWDLRKGIRTEVDYLNGFWVRRGREVGIPTPINERLVRDIKQRERENDEMRSRQPEQLLCTQEN